MTRKKIGFRNSTITFFADSMIIENIRSLNDAQHQVFDILNEWCRDYMKNLNSKVVVNRRFWVTFSIFFACILLDLQKNTRKSHIFLDAPQTYT